MQSKDEKINKALGFLKDAKNYVHRAEQILNDIDKVPVSNAGSSSAPLATEPLEQDLNEEPKVEQEQDDLNKQSNDEIVPGLEDFSKNDIKPTQAVENKEQNEDPVQANPSIIDDEEEEVIFKPVEPDHDLANDVLDRPSNNTVTPEQEKPEEQTTAQGIKELDI